MSTKNGVDAVDNFTSLSEFDSLSTLGNLIVEVFLDCEKKNYD